MSLTISTISIGIRFVILLCENTKTTMYNLKNGGLNYVTSF